MEYLVSLLRAKSRSLGSLRKLLCYRKYSTTLFLWFCQNVKSALRICHPVLLRSCLIIYIWQLQVLRPSFQFLCFLLFSVLITLGLQGLGFDNLFLPFIRRWCEIWIGILSFSLELLSTRLRRFQAFWQLLLISTSVRRSHHFFLFSSDTDFINFSPFSIRSISNVSVNSSNVYTNLGVSSGICFIYQINQQFLDHC